jgi:DNA modification methylase
VDNFALDILGFDVDELKNLLDPVKPTEGLTDEDEVPEVPEEPKTKPGDIYRLGKHRLMCGDSTSIDAVEKLMDGQKADVVFTSPPYNANTKVGNVCIFTSKKSKKLYDEGFSDNLESSEYVDFASSVLENCFLVTNGFIFWNVSYNANSRFEYIQQIYGRLPFLIEQICWKKSSTIPFKGSLMRDWEPIYLFSTNKEKLGLEDVVSNHWAISNTNSQTENHKACFPVELPEKGINLIKVKTGIVFEPFAGSGSTMIACQKLGRTNFSMELDPKYCDVIVKRWEDFTGQKAELLN